MAKTVFISYSSCDELFVKRIIEMIEKAGLSYWKAPEMIPAGSNYAREIPKAIQKCDVFLLVVSKGSQESIWVEKEVDSAINYRKTIVPVRIDDEPLNDMYRFYLNNVQMLSFVDEKEKFYKYLEGVAGSRAESSDVVASHTMETRPAVEASPMPESRIERPTSDAYMEPRKESIRIQNAFTLNKAPVECGHCQGALERVSNGIYQCVVCGRENYDYLQTVKRYLQDRGPTNAVIISRDTGVPKSAIDYFLKEEYISVYRSGRR